MYKIYRLTAFPKNNKGGNLAGVCLNADDLSDSQMQKIAKEIGYSETAFVLDSQKADIKIRFFTPLKEVDLCGHATIATINLLRDLNLLSLGLHTQETNVGILSLDIEKEKVFMEQLLPLFSEFIDKKDIQLAFSNLAFNGIYNPQIVSTGIREIFLPIKDFTALKNLTPNFEKIIELSKKYDVIGVHAFCTDTEVDGYGRNFAPIVGISEESATGTSNGALACYFYQYIKQKNNYIFRQGYSMNLPSQIEVKLETDQSSIKKVYVGGTAKRL